MILRVANGFVRAGVWLSFLIIVLAALYLAAGRVFVYSFASDKERIEALLVESGFNEVSIEAVNGGWHVFDPALEVVGVRLSAEKDSEIFVRQLWVKINTVRSVVERSPIVSEVKVTGVKLAVVADHRGFRVKGLPESDGTVNLDPLLDSVPHLMNLELSDVEVTIEGRDYEVVLRDRAGEPWRLSGNTAVKSVSLPVYVQRGAESAENRLALTGTYSGDVRSNGFSADLYLSAPDLAIANFLPELPGDRYSLGSINLSTEVWLTAGPGKVRAVGVVELSEASLKDGADHISLADSGRIDFGYIGDSFVSGTLNVPVMEIGYEDFRFRLSDILTVFSSSDSGVTVAAQIPVMDVSEIAELLRFAGDRSLLPGRFIEGLSKVNPRGELKNINFMRSPATGEPVLAARVSDLSMDAYLGVPAISPLNGFIHMEPRQGYLDIDNDTFQLNFSNMFSKPWPFDSGRGRISWEVLSDRVQVNSGLIELVQNDLEAMGKVSLNLPPTRQNQTWGLTIGIRDADLLEAERYIPNTIPENLTTWLKSAILGGDAPAVGMTFHGALFRGAPRVRKSHDLFFAIEDTSMKYHVDWPVIRQAGGVVHVTNHFVSSDDLTGKVFDTDLAKAELFAPIMVSGQADTVFVDAKGEGPLSDIVRVLNETPLRETTSGMAAQWLATGRMSAAMELNVPVGPRAGEDVLVITEVEFEGATLTMPEFDLDVTSLQGTASYSTEKGLRSNNFTGVTFSESIEGYMETDLHGDGGEIRVIVDGAISARSLYEWSDQVLLSRAEGKLDYRTTVHVPYGGEKDEAYVEASSDLEGVVLNLPYPLNKPEAESRRSFQYSQYFQKDGYRVDMALDDTARASLKIEGGIAVGGRVHFGAEAFGAIAYDQIRMTGHLDYLDFGNWMAATDELGELTDVSLEDEIAAHVESVELRIDELLIFELLLEEAAVRVTRGEKAWLATIDNEMMLGDVRVEDDDELPIDIRLARLNFESGEDEEADPLGDVDPMDIGDINFSTNSLMIDGEDYGNWAFDFRVKQDRVRFENLTASAAGLRVLPSSRLEWLPTDGGTKSRFSGDVEVDDLAYALQKFGLASSIEGKGLKVGADIEWRGSPAMVDVDHVVGVVTVHEGEGRFVQAETGGALKLLGIFDFASIARRLRLDFSDVVEKGFEFDEISGVTSFNEGRVAVVDPIVIEGSSGRFTIGGEVNLKTSSLDNEIIVTLPVSRTLPWYAAYSAIATGPLAGAGVMIAQKVFENQIDQMSSAKYKVSGSIDEPSIEFVAIFDDKVAEVSVEPAPEPIEAN